MAEHIDKEIEAIKAVLLALDPLPPEIRTSVLGYVIKRFQIALGPVQATEVSSTSGPSADAALGATEAMARTEQKTTPTHIKDLKEKKKPRTASEMAALVAYYLEEVASPKDRKDRITTKVIDTYFKIAEFPLPKSLQFTLPNAKAAGYLDAVGNGEYKLNAVGHNLVVHGMPRGADSKAVSRRKPAKKKARRPAKTK